jgi:hypothetical protein
LEPQRTDVEKESGGSDVDALMRSHALTANHAAISATEVAYGDSASFGLLDDGVKLRHEFEIEREIVERAATHANRKAFEASI